MTVCIAALADNGKHLVLETDKMLTASTPVPYEYEQDDIKKIVAITANTKVLMAGFMQHALTIVERAKAKITGTKSTEQVATVLKGEYDLFRKQWLEEGILKPRGIQSLDDYYANHGKYQSSLTQTIDQLIATSQFDIQFIIAGSDGAECHIYTIFNNLPLQRADAVGYVTTGSGGSHAAYALLDAGYSKTLSLADVEKMVDNAKTKSESSPGVGKGTLKETISIAVDEKKEK